MSSVTPQHRTIEVRVLGPVEVTVDSEPVAIASPAHRRLLTALAEAGSVSEDDLTDVLWEGDPPSDPKAALQVHVSRLRRTIGSAAIAWSPAGYRLVADTDLDRWRRSIASDDPSTQESALELVRGVPLADGGDHPIMVARRRAIEEELVSATLAVADALVGQGREVEAIGRLEALVAHRTFDETVWIALAETQHRLGRQHDAIATLRRHREAVTEAGLEPSESFEAAEDAVFRPPSVVDRRRRVGPRPSRFFGRSEELALVRRGLDRNRVVTLVGAAGMGKTRLAEEALLRSPMDHVAIPLAAVPAGADRTFVEAAIARAVGVRTGADELSGVITALGSEQIVLLLDNCEHLADTAAAVVEELMTRSSDLRVLATGRSPLGMTGELVVEVGPLDAGVELFVDRAGGTGAPPEVVDEVCRRLDHMPLAIEMAAQRARTIAAEDLLTMLDEGPLVLDAAATSDQRTLERLVAWSYDLLDPSDRRVFLRASRFAGSFTADDAATVCAVDPHEAIVRLSRLVEHSMVGADKHSGTTRFRMLATLRAFARRRLEASGEEAAAAIAHANWTLSQLRIHDAGLGGEDGPRHLEEMRRLVPDLILAVDGAMVRGDHARTAALLGSTFTFSYLTAEPGIGPLAVDAIARLEGDPPDPVLCAVAALGRIAAGDLDAAESLVDSCEWNDDVPWQVAAVESDLAIYRGDRQRAERAAMALPEDSRTAALGGPELNLAVTAAYDGDLDEAFRLAGMALERARVSRSPFYLSLAEYCAGEVAQDVEPEHALEHLRRSVALARRSGNRFVEGIASVTIASILARQGRHDEATETFRDVIDLWISLGSITHLWTTLRNLTMMLADSGRNRDAAVLLGATDDRISPTFGPEADRLARVTAQLRTRLGAEFTEAEMEGRLTPTLEVAALARRMLAPTD